MPTSSSSLLEGDDLARKLEANTSGLGSFHELNEFSDAIIIMTLSIESRNIYNRVF